MSGDLGSNSFSEFYEPCDLAEVITIKANVTPGRWLQGTRYVSGVVLGLTSTSKLCPGRRGATGLIWLNPEHALRVNLRVNVLCSRSSSSQTGHAID